MQPVSPDRTPENIGLYMSSSQYGDFLSCEAMALARVEGLYQPEETKACLQGRMLHAWAAGGLDDFLQNTPGLFKQKGGLYAEYEAVMDMIHALEGDPRAADLLTGDKGVLFIAPFAGALWMVRLDVYRPDLRRIVDVKSTRSIREKVWDGAQGRVSFVESYDYLRQAAIRAEVERVAGGRPPGDWYDTYLLAVSKEEPPDKEIISLVDADRYTLELAEIKERMPRILEVKSGRIPPARCECCPYCRLTKTLGEGVHYTAL